MAHISHSTCLSCPSECKSPSGACLHWTYQGRDLEASLSHQAASESFCGRETHWSSERRCSSPVTGGKSGEAFCANGIAPVIQMRRSLVLTYLAGVEALHSLQCSQIVAACTVDCPAKCSQQAPAWKSVLGIPTLTRTSSGSLPRTW